MLLCLPAQALYKVVGPDGKVTYTDRIPSTADGKVTPLNAGGNSVAADPSALPFDLRQVAMRYPVTLYAVADCAPCDNARALLRQRGIPHAERLVSTEEDVEALQRLTGTRDAPTLTIGQQPLRGFSAETWNAYLDSAGYPRESRLPVGYQFPAATALTERREPARPAAAASAAARTQAEPPTREATAPAAPGIRF
jgi:glutaredoxin